MDFAIEVDKLSKLYPQGTLALDDVSFRVPKNTVFGVLGSNGAGKTTLIRILTGILKPSSGVVRILGVDSWEKLSGVRSELGVLPQEGGLYEELTLFENLDFFARLRDLPEKRERIMEVLELVGLDDKHDVEVKEFSGGMKRRAMIARALLGNPKILFLDEPTIGLDVIVARKIRLLLKDLAQDHTLIVATHNMSEAEFLCDEVILMQRGKILYHDTPRGLLQAHGQKDDSFEDVVFRLLSLDEEENE